MCCKIDTVAHYAHTFCAQPRCVPIFSPKREGITECSIGKNHPVTGY